MDKALVFNFVVAMLSIINPLGNLPLFIGYTAGERIRVRKWIALFVAVTVGLSIILLLIFGNQLLDFFGITIASFQISGGILVMLIGIGMTRGEQTKFDRQLGAKVDPNDLIEAELVYGRILVPLGIPIFIGPGAIGTAILYSSRVRNNATLFGLMIAAVAIALVVLLVLLIANRLQSFLGTIGIEIATRLFGLILTAIGMQFILNGLAKATIGLINPAVVH
jgi:multiple antibiotic resistance protein